ncbi:MAG: glycosyltransferase family 4 protein, partial [Deltaproteobacteria bacterium]|nr:glycosyltransferase family 4 protein [Deltaproteobacteria bacterium]
NFDMFLDIAKRMVGSRKQICFCLVGGAGEKPASQTLEKHLRNRVEQEGMSDFVRFLGRSKNVAGILPHFSVFLCTSDWEGCPNVVLEAMRAQLPVVMTDCADTKLLIDAGKNGYVVALGDAEAVSQHTNELLNDSEKCKRFGKRSREMAEENFSASNNAWLLARIYMEEWKKVQGILK